MMKIIFGIMIVFAGSAFAHDHPSVHGMVAFGGSGALGDSKVLLSHMPMFHSPHDYQVVMSASLDEVGQASFASARSAANPDALVTVVPEPFALDEFIAHPHSFKASLYAGHFERGGVVIASDVKVTVESIIFAKKIAVGVKAPPEFSFKESANGFCYSMHVINEVPSFDQIVKSDCRPRGTGLSSVIYREDQDLQ